MPRRRHCPWCGTALPEQAGAGRPRQTCGRARCRRLNAAHRRREADHATRLAEQEILAEQAERRVADVTAAVEEKVAAVVRGIQNARDMTGPHARLDPSRRAALLDQALTDHVLPRLRELADYARAQNQRRTP